MIRAIGFIAAGMAAGFLSGILATSVWGIHGAILGGMLAGGVLACDAHRKKNRHLPLALVLAIAATVSLAAFLPIFGWDKIIVDPIDAPQTTWHGVFTCFFISLGVLLGCSNSSLGYFFWIPLLSVIPRAIGFKEGLAEETRIGALTVSLFCFAFGLCPFLLLWGGVARLFGFLRKTPTNAGDCAVAGKEEA